MGGATYYNGVPIAATLFQSTLPVGGATTKGKKQEKGKDISIHAPRGGSDPSSLGTPSGPFYFNPRSPWGERREWDAKGRKEWLFQSTLPVGGATAPPLSPGCMYHNFNPRSPWGEQQSVNLPATNFRDFNPRSPWGEQRNLLNGIDDSGLFQSTLPVGGATNVQSSVLGIAPISIHAPRGGSNSKDAQIFLLHLRQKGYFL